MSSSDSHHDHRQQHQEPPLHPEDAPPAKTLNDAIKFYLPPRMLYVPGVAITVGIALGLTRGGRKAAMQFLAENAHKAPKTVKGWYEYNRTKNYRVMLGGLKGAGREGLRLGSVAVGWVTLEELLKNKPFPMVGAGVGTCAIFATLCSFLSVISFLCTLCTVCECDLRLKMKLCFRPPSAPYCGTGSASRRVTGG